MIFSLFFLVRDIGCWASGIADVQSDYGGWAVGPDMSRHSPGIGCFRGFLF